MQQQGNQESDFKTSFNALTILVAGWSWCFLPFLRFNMGSNAIGMRGILAIIVIWVYTAFTKCPEMIPFFCLWLGFVIIQRLRTAQLVRRGVVMHSKYAGDPMVMKFLPFIRKVQTARLLEVAICFFTGMFLIPVSPNLGGFFVFGSMALGIFFAIDDQAIRNRQQAMRDAEIEQRFYADLHRGRRDDW